VVCTVATPACRPVPGAKAGDVGERWASGNQSLFVHQLQREQPQVDRIDVASGRRTAWKTVRPLNPAVCGAYALMVSPDGTVAYGYRADASQLYTIKGLK